jgi:hypothetical protein
MKTQNRTILLFTLVFITVFPLVLLSSCDKDTDENRIGKVITGIQKSAENKDIKGILSNLSKTYRDPQGNDYEGIKGLVLFYFLRHQRISVFLTGLEISLHESRATARFHAVLSAKTGSTGSILPEALGAYRFIILLARESGEWRVTSAQWERMGDGVEGPS